MADCYHLPGRCKCPNPKVVARRCKEEYERGRHAGRTDPPGFGLTRDETLQKLHDATFPTIRAYWRGYLVGRKERST